MSPLLLGSSSELRDPSALISLGFEPLSSISLAISSLSLLSLGIVTGLPSPDTILLTTEFSKRVTQQGLWYKTTPMSCELENGCENVG